MNKNKKQQRQFEDSCQQAKIQEYIYYGEKLGLKITEYFGWLEVSNGYDRFRFEVTNGKTRLLHHSNRVLGRDVYHEQFCRYISPKDLMTYIKEHGLAKVSGKWVRFSVAA
ncbi:MAG: hypothetical protein Q4D21_03090 [Phascolarctobacterium sp.]|nr:hypothetical protein [Phascolarctobacterium sp.]